VIRYIFRRLLQTVPTVLGVVLINFILFNVVGQSPALMVLGNKATAESLEEFDEARGYNKPLFFGSRTQTRAYEDHAFSDGSGRWRTWDDTSYFAKSASVVIHPMANFSPLAFDPGPEHEYEWTITYRGDGRLAGQALASKDWKTEKILFQGSETSGFKSSGFQTLEIKKLKLRKVVENPFDSQLLFYLKQLGRGDLGFSEYFKQPVAKLLADGVVPSLSLTVPIFFIGVVVSISLSLVCAFFRDTWVDRSLVLVSVALMSINYLVYIVAGQYVLAYKMGAFPVWGYESWRYLVLPVIIGVVSGLGSNIRFYRTVMLDEMYKDYVRTAFAKGLSKPRVLFVHVLKNAMIPIITNVVIAIPFLYTGSLLLESFFGIPGLGYLGINAIMSSDIDVVRALVLIGALLFVAANLITDLCYAAADPRVKLK